jgi:hypothetical protein
MALYETFEYAACYRNEKKAQRQKMIENLSTQPSARNNMSTNEADHSESQRLLDDDSETAIVMESFNVREVVSDGDIRAENTEQQSSENEGPLIQH